MLIATRALLGVAGATVMPSTMALIRNMFVDPKQMAVAISVWLSCFMGGTMLGPLVGGLLLERFWWGSAFLLGVPFMAVLMVAGPVFLPEHRDAGSSRLDLVSVGLSLAMILPVIYGLKEIARGGLETAPVLAVAIGVAMGVAFVRRQRRLADPLLDLRLLTNLRLGTALGAFLMTGVVMAGVSLMTALYMQTVLGLSPLQAGLWLIPPNIAMVVGLQIAPHLTRRLPPAYVMAGGLVAAAFGLFLLIELDGVGRVVAGLGLAMFGVAFAMAEVNNMIMAAAPPERAGSAAALSETSGEFGIAFGVATLGTLGGAVYRHYLPGQAPDGVPGEAVEAAREGITAAVATASRLPSALGAELLDGARAAFTIGVGAVGIAGGVIFLVTAAMLAVVLGRRPAEAETIDRVDEVPAESPAVSNAAPA
jgi:DHA2 family multidrug resistance protein-like MFS transporter